MRSISRTPARVSCARPAAACPVVPGTRYPDSRAVRRIRLGSSIVRHSIVAPSTRPHSQSLTRQERLRKPPKRFRAAPPSLSSPVRVYVVNGFSVWAETCTSSTGRAAPVLTSSPSVVLVISSWSRRASRSSLPRVDGSASPRGRRPSASRGAPEPAGRGRPSARASPPAGSGARSRTCRTCPRTDLPTAHRPWSRVRRSASSRSSAATSSARARASARPSTSSRPTEPSMRWS